MTGKQLESHLKGISICSGIAIGKAFFFELGEDDIPEFTIAPNDIEAEIDRYRAAIIKSKEDIRRLQRQLEKENIIEGAAILDAYLQIMDDPLITSCVEDIIRKNRKNPESAFQTVIRQYQKRFQSVKDPFFRERFRDIQDISRRVMGYLLQSLRVSLADIQHDSIIFSRELTAADTAEANVDSIKGFVTAIGGSASHAAIMAKAKGIPYVTDVKIDEISTELEGSLVIIDGRTGDLYLNPSHDTLDRYKSLKMIIPPPSRPNML